jgi:hypothetical protein
MIFVVAPEPADWVAPLVEDLARQGPVTVLAPWRMAGPPRVPAALGAFVARRRLSFPGVTVLRWPAWPAVEAAMRVWERGENARLVRGRLAVRRLVDAIAARMMPGGVRTVVAPTGAGERVFAVAARRGAEAILVHDTPNLRALHDDLDRASARHADQRSLRRYRATPGAIARQEAEYVLARRILVRGSFAQSLLEAHGHGPKVERLAAPAPPPIPRAGTRPGASRTVLLAGAATARSGVIEAIAAIAAVPGLTLLARAPDPPDLLRAMGSRARAPTRAEVERLEGVAAVVAPALCEAYPREVVAAVSAGIPAITTDRAAWFEDTSRVPTGDAGALAAALRVAVGVESAAAAPPLSSAVADASRSADHRRACVSRAPRP